MIASLLATVVQALPEQAGVVAEAAAATATHEGINYFELMLRASLPVKLIVLLLLAGSVITDSIFGLRGIGPGRAQAPGQQGLARLDQRLRQLHQFGWARIAGREQGGGGAGLSRACHRCGVCHTS